MEQQLKPVTTSDSDEPPAARQPASNACCSELSRSLVWQLTLADQRERRRFATELHDDLAQILVVCKMKLDTMGCVGDPRAEAVIAEVGGLLDRSLERARTLIARLSPTVLHDGGLNTAIQWLVRHMQRHNLTVRVAEQLPDDTLAIPASRAIVFFQAIQELLLNVARHAGVNQATLRLRRERDELTATVADDGIGFDLHAWNAAPTQAHGYGLFNMRERLAAAGGTFRIDTSRGQGTQVTLSVPLCEAEPDGAPSAEAHRASESSAAATPARPEAQPHRLNILLADDHAIVRQGLRSVIESQADLRVIAEAGNGLEAVDLVERLRPDVVMLDISMPGMTGIEAARRISQKAPSAHVIGLSVHDDPGMAASMRRAGAAHYLIKGGPLDELYSAIRAARRAPTPTAGVGS